LKPSDPYRYLKIEYAKEAVGNESVVVDKTNEKQMIRYRFSGADERVRYLCVYGQNPPRDIVGKAIEEPCRKLQGMRSLLRFNFLICIGLSTSVKAVNKKNGSNFDPPERG